ncbi:MAG: hypothetical protein ACREND_09915, partial [Gemmatimonadaceae bacterium]
LLGWAMLMSSLLSLALPLTAPSSMTRVEWVSLVTLTAYFVIALAALVGIVRNPRLTVAVLAPAAAYAGVSLAYQARKIVATGTDRLAGPAPAISFVLSASLLIAVVAAFALAWPLRQMNGGAAR